MAEAKQPTVAEVLNAAVVGSRGLDCQVAVIAGWHRVEPRFTRNKKGGWISPEDWIGSESNGAPILDSLHGTTIHRDPPQFTTSLDAAVALVQRKLPGWAYCVSTFTYTTEATAVLHAAGLPQHSETATSAPLALCKALLSALRAAASKQVGGGDE